MNAPDRVLTIKLAVVEHFGLTLSDMTSKRRPQYIAWPRQVAMHLAREGVIAGSGNKRVSLDTIGELFWNRDHATVIHADRVVKDRCLYNARDRMDVLALKQKLAGVLECPPNPIPDA